MKIFEPIMIKRVQFQNRIVMAPMVPFGMPQLPFGTMSETVIKHYIDRVVNGMGLMILQALSVTSKAPHDGGAGAYADEHMRFLHTIADACHERGAKLFAQLAYPSIGYKNGDSVNRIAVEELAKITGEFVRAAFRCKEAGCDGIELHGAHGFFLNMFASPLANKREDDFGGGLESRLHLAHDIIFGIRSFLDDNFILSYRMGWNDDLDTDIKTAQLLETFGVELLHVSSGIPANRDMTVPVDFPYNSVVFSGTEIKKHVKAPVTVVNNIQTLNRGNMLLDEGLCDFVAFGRPFLADTEFVTRSENNYDYHPCLNCKTCKWFTDGKKCPVR